MANPGHSSAASEGRLWPAAALVLAMATTLTLRLWIYVENLVPFNSDEAIVGLMARHIVDGARPIFFYGQAYMGSLDAWLIAGSFQLFGEGLAGIRAVQIVLYVLFLVTTWFLARRLYGARVAAWTVLLASVPPVLILTYTSATLGGYGETLVLGNLVLLLGHTTLESGSDRSTINFALLGAIGGLAFWTLGIAGVYLAPVAILHLLHFDRKKLVSYLLAMAGFVLASAPWWIANFRLGGEAMAALTTGYPLASSPYQRLLGLVALGIPALFGLRFPWSPTYVSLPIVFLGTILHTGILLHVIDHYRSTREAPSLGTRMLLIMVAVFVVAFLGTQFGIDSTGRYLLPLYLPLSIAAGHLIDAAWDWRRASAIVLLGMFLLLNLAGLRQAVGAGEGLTTQFDPISRFGNEHDELLIRFLEREGISTGYSNYWVAYRIAFLTDESITLAPALPYKEDLSYTPRDDRLDGYRLAADRADDIVYVTTLHPELDAVLRKDFRQAGTDFREVEIGPYRVFYDFSRPIRPTRFEFGPDGA